MDKKAFFTTTYSLLLLLFICLFNSITLWAQNDDCQQAKKHFDESIEFIESKDYVPALMSAQKAVNAAEKSCTVKERARYYVLRARVYERLNVPKNAAKDFAKAQKLLTQIAIENAPTPSPKIKTKQASIAKTKATKKTPKPSSNTANKKELDIDFEWISHSPYKSTVQTYLPKQLIQLKVLSNEPLKSSDFEVLVNQHNVKGALFGYAHSELEPLSDQKKSGFTKYAYQYSYYPLLKKGKNTVAIKANKNGASASSPTIEMNFTPVNNTLKVLSIVTDSTTNFATQDAQDLSNLFKENTEQLTQELFQKVETEELIGTNATLKNIKQVIQNQQLNHNDFLLIYLSLPAFTPENTEQVYFIGSDYKPDGFLGSTTLPYQQLLTLLDSIPSQKLLLLNICHPAIKKLPPNLNVIAQTLDQHPELNVLLSNSVDELAHEDEKWGNSALMESVLKALKSGHADGYNKLSLKDGTISINELARYITDKLPKLVEKAEKKTTQTPQFFGNALSELGIFVTKK